MTYIQIYCNTTGNNNNNNSITNLHIYMKPLESSVEESRTHKTANCGKKNALETFDAFPV